MTIFLISIGPKRGRGKRHCEDLLVDEYLLRAGRMAAAESRWVETETSFWDTLDRLRARTLSRVILMDSGGTLLTSAEFAAALGGFRDTGTQQIVVGVGGANGWTAEGKARADLLVSIGKLTLPHSLARVVAAEQIYRATTILMGHPYHCGH